MTTSLEQAIAEASTIRSLGRISSLQVFWVFLAAVLACVTLTLVTDTFATERNLFNVTRNFAFVGIIAIGMTTVIISGGIDLSVGASVVLSAMVIGVTMAAGYPFWLSALAAIGAVAAGRAGQRRADRLCRHPALRRDAGHAVRRAVAGAGAVQQQDDLRVRARSRPAAAARRRLDVRDPATR